MDGSNSSKYALRISVEALNGNLSPVVVRIELRNVINSIILPLLGVGKLSSGMKIRCRLGLSTARTPVLASANCARLSLWFLCIAPDCNGTIWYSFSTL